MKKLNNFIIFGIVLILFLVSCGSENNNSIKEPIEEQTYYSVIFDTQGGSNIAAQSVAEGNKVIRPNNPVKKGYQFNCWLKDGKMYNFSSTINNNVVLVADWNPLMYQLGLVSNVENSSTLLGAGKYYFNSEVTIESKTNPGYIFIGWFDGNVLISNEEKYTFSMRAKDLTYEARYAMSTNVKYKVNHYKKHKVDGHYIEELVDTEIFYGTTNELLNSSDYAKEYENYHLFTTSSEYRIKGNGTTEIPVYYLIDSHHLTLTVNNSQYGKVRYEGNKYNGGVDIDYGTNYTIHAIQNQGYTFVGWYDENGLVSEDSEYTFTMPANNLYYEARFAPSTTTLYKVEHYQQNIDNSDYSTTPYEVDELYGTTDSNTEAVTKTYDGFTSLPFTQQKINPDGTTVIKIYYLRQSKTLTLNRNNTSAGTVTGAGTYKYGMSITIKAISNPGYTFIGWYYENELVSKDAEYTFEMPANNTIYEARYNANSNILYKVEHYKQNLENTNYPSVPNEVDELYGTTGQLTQANAKDYEGFTSNSFNQVKINGDGTTLIKIYYFRNSFSLELNSNNSKAGTVSGSGTYKYGEEVIISIITNPGYIFEGWYEGTNEVYSNDAIIFNMTPYRIVYTAKWTANPNTPYKVEHYIQNLEDDNYVLFETDNLYGMTDTLTNGFARVYEGFTSPSIEQINIDGNGDTIIKLYYIRNVYNVVLNKNIGKAGIVNGSGTYNYGKVVTISATFNEGYTFKGWYSNDEFYRNDLSFDLEICTNNIILEARYSINKYTITLDNQIEGSTLEGIVSGNEYYYDTEINITMTGVYNRLIGWKIDDEYVNVGKKLSFKVPSKNIFITILESATYIRINNKIYFGSYPQQLLTDEDTIEQLNLLACELPVVDNLYNWVDYNYYIAKNITSYMYYQDIDYDGDGMYDYRGVYFTQYRPSKYNSISNADYSSQDNNGYYINNVYWFILDSIEWDIINEENGKALIVSDLILDAQEYYATNILGSNYGGSSSFDHNGGTGRANNYDLSNIKKWLNENFYNNSFSIVQKEFIDESSNSNLFLLSYDEVDNYISNSSVSISYGTDYAFCNGLTNTAWILRTPYDYRYTHTATGYASTTNTYFSVYMVSPKGAITKYDTESAQILTYVELGIRPALWILF